MLLVLLAKQKNEEESLFWQCSAGKTSPRLRRGQARQSQGKPRPLSSLRRGEYKTFVPWCEV